MKSIDDICLEALERLRIADNERELEDIRIQYLGKKGILTKFIKKLNSLPNKDKPIFGQAINRAKLRLQEAIANHLNNLDNKKLRDQSSNEKIDITLPGTSHEQGTLHPLSKEIGRIEDFFSCMGFSIEYGPEIETDYYNFEALNIPSHHPARAMHDTFYFTSHTLLRTHTSSVQVRTMEKQLLPIQMIAPGRAYRCDSDITHTPMFHQVEGLWIDNKVSFSNLKGLLTNFLTFFFERSIKTRFRPSYFPFTTSSAEVDIMCVTCNGQGCSICKNSGWLEVLGCGMVHPNVLRSNGIDNKKYQGFAFGVGVERITMLRYTINDLRLFFENDLCFLKQF